MRGQPLAFFAKGYVFLPKPKILMQRPGWIRIHLQAEDVLPQRLRQRIDVFFARRPTVRNVRWDITRYQQNSRQIPNNEIGSCVAYRTEAVLPAVQSRKRLPLNSATVSTAGL